MLFFQGDLGFPLSTGAEGWKWTSQFHSGPSQCLVSINFQFPPQDRGLFLCFPLSRKGRAGLLKVTEHLCKSDPSCLDVPTLDILGIQRGRRVVASRPSGG